MRSLSFDSASPRCVSESASARPGPVRPSGRGLPAGFTQLAALAALFLGALALLAAQPAPAADPDLPDVASAPRRMEVPVDHVAGSITVIQRSEIERKGLRTLSDALRMVPGVQVTQAGGAGAQTSLFVRGTESNHVLVLVDGIEVSDPSLPGGVFDSAHLLTEDVERIEVMRGPLSTLYGSDALGGVINVVTRQGRGKPRLSAWAEAGARHAFQQASALRGSNELVHYSLSYSTLHTRGHTAVSEDRGAHERDGYDNRTLSGRIGLTPTGASELSLVGRFVDTDSDLDPFFEDLDNRGQTRQLFLRAEGRLDLLGGAWRQRLGASYSDHDRGVVDDADPLRPDSSIESHDGGRLKLDWQHDLFITRQHVLTLGLETERETIDSSLESVSSFGVFTSRAHASQRSSAAFAQEQFTFGDRLFGAVGARLEHHEEFGSELTYRAAAAWVHPGWATKIHGSIATGFKAPSLDDLFGVSVFTSPFFTSLSVGNPDLEPERNRGWELGAEQPLFGGRVRAGVTYFENRIRNLIEVTPDFTTLRNVGRAKTDGFESFLSVRLGDRLFLRVDHVYLRAEDRDRGRDLLRRPSHTVLGTLELRPVQGSTVSLAVRHIGRRTDIDADSPVGARISLGGYTVVNLAGTLELSRHWALFGRIENLFDREYDDPHGFQSSGFAGFAGLRTEY